MNCHWLSRWIYDNRAMVVASVWMVISAFIVAMPEPGTPWNWRTIYAWIYDALHQFGNLKRPTGAAEKPLQRIN